MPGAELAQYGIAIFAVAGLIYVVSQWLQRRDESSLTEVIQNNTRALEQIATVVQSIQLSMTRQEQKIDELLERARR